MTFVYLCYIIYIQQWGESMKLIYKTKKLHDLCELSSNNKNIIKMYGSDVGIKLPMRIEQLKSFNCIGDIPVFMPFRRHKLEGNYKDCYAVNINNKYRLIFKAVNGTDLFEINEIEILEVSKHYE